MSYGKGNTLEDRAFLDLQFRSPDVSFASPGFGATQGKYIFWT